MSGSEGLRRVPLHETHRKLGARMVAFAGWEMPVEYTSILEEHRAVRERVGLFDVSHMGEIEIWGAGALALVNYVTVNDAARLTPGRAQYSALLYEHGGFVDDIVVHRVREDYFFLCVNAANQEKDYEHICRYNRWGATVELASDRYVQLALQGPLAEQVLQRLTSVNLSELRYYSFVDSTVAGVSARVARTGYTGEDGFEIYVEPGSGEHLWNALLEAGKDFGIRPCGLGARNSLRLEAGYVLYGNDIDASVRPFEANLGWIVKFDKGDFVGRAAIEPLRERVNRRLVGFEVTGRGIARDGYEVLVDGRHAGWVTSGGFSPSLNRSIGLCYLPAGEAVPGRPIQILIRGKPVDARVRETPFYRGRR